MKTIRVVNSFMLYGGDPLNPNRYALAIYQNGFFLRLITSWYDSHSELSKVVQQGKIEPPQDEEEAQIPQKMQAALSGLRDAG